MYGFFQKLAEITVPIFVVSTMLNVGLTQKLADIVEYLKARSFFIKMVIANFVAAPLLMIVAMRLFSFDPALEAGLLIFSVCAGAPFLIKLTLTSQHDLALGAAVMMVLVILTVIVAPIALPLMLEGISVDAWAIARSLIGQLLMPIVIGMLAATYLPSLVQAVQPWVARLGNYTLYVVIVATLVGYLPNLWDIVKTGALLVGLAFVIVVFGFGYLAGAGSDHLEDIGGLGTAQRNTAAGMIIAIQNFSDPNVMVMLTLVNTLGIVLLIGIATMLSRDNDGVKNIRVGVS
jgi:bile acid:Na+ symporter, BASS family